MPENDEWNRLLWVSMAGKLQHVACNHKAGDNHVMPSFVVQGQVIEVSTTDYYLYWYRWMEPFVNLLAYFSYFPNRDSAGKRELEETAAFLRVNLEWMDDPELREQAAALLALVEPLPAAHQAMLDQVTAQLGVRHPQSSQGKRQFTIKWNKLAAGEAPTEAMKRALTTLQAYTAWLDQQIQEIMRTKEQFQQRVVTRYPEIVERLRNP